MKKMIISLLFVCGYGLLQAQEQASIREIVQRSRALTAEMRNWIAGFPERRAHILSLWQRSQAANLDIHHQARRYSLASLVDVSSPLGHHSPEFCAQGSVAAFRSQSVPLEDLTQQLENSGYTQPVDLYSPTTPTTVIADPFEERVTPVLRVSPTGLQRMPSSPEVGEILHTPRGVPAGVPTLLAKSLPEWRERGVTIKLEDIPVRDERGDLYIEIYDARAIVEQIIGIEYTHRVVMPLRKYNEGAKFYLLAADLVESIRQVQQRAEHTSLVSRQR